MNETLVLQKIMTYLFDLPHGPKVTQMIKAYVQIWLELHT